MSDQRIMICSLTWRLLELFIMAQFTW